MVGVDSADLDLTESESLCIFLELRSQAFPSVKPNLDSNDGASLHQKSRLRCSLTVVRGVQGIWFQALRRKVRTPVDQGQCVRVKTARCQTMRR